MRGRIVALAFAAFFMAAPPVAAEVRLDGAVEQGGLVVGRVPPGASVALDGRALRVDADGGFIFGLGRDATEVVLAVRHPDGREESRRLTVAKRDWPVQRIDGLPPRQVTPDEKALVRIRTEAALIADRRDRDSPAPGYRSGFRSPAEGRVSGVFGSQRVLNGEPRAPHAGVDVAAPEGSPVAAAADGVVSLAHPDMFFTGVTVMIDHGHGLASVYAHLKDAAVREGQAVRQGEVIGSVGATGRATGPHLHWGVSWFDVKLDPETVLGVLSGGGP